MANNVDERVVVKGTPEQRAALVLWFENHYDMETKLGKIYMLKSVPEFTEEEFQGFYIIDLVSETQKDQTILTFWSKWGTREELWNHVIKEFDVELWVHSKDSTNEDFTLYHGNKNGWVLIESGHYLEMYYLEQSPVVQKAQKLLEEHKLEGPEQIQYEFKNGVKYEEMDPTEYYVSKCVEILNINKIENNLSQEYEVEKAEKKTEKPKESDADDFDDYLAMLEAQK